MNLRALILFASLFVTLFASANTYTVTTTADTGNGSFRKAITDVNVTPGTHSIVFNIPTSDLNYVPSQGVWKITPATTLPIITRSNLLIDGTTQTINQGDKNIYGPEILFDGNHQYGSDYAFNLYNTSNVTIKGFIIGRFTIGIAINGTNCMNNTILGNYIGCNYNATDSLSNNNGIEMLGSKNNIIGGSTVADRNIVSGNIHVGIRMANSNGNVVKGNYVGLNRTGNGAIKNSDGISIEGASKNNLVGGYTPEDRNYVSGNIAYGIPLFGAGCDYNKIVGNYVGTDVTGTIAIPNTYGVLCDDGASHNRIGGYEAGAGNLFSGNSGYGVFLYNPGTQNDSVIGNLIGTNYSGMVALPNGNGIVVDGPTFNHFIDRNVISGNAQSGIILHLVGTDNNVIVRNKIGVGSDGIQALGNGFDGVRIGEGPKFNKVGRVGEGNIIAYNGGNGITVMTVADLYNTFSENSIYRNGGIGIDLYPQGVTANDVGDADSGPNDLLNYPEIQTVNYDGNSGVTTITGIMDYSINAGPLGIKVELFISYNTQGKEYIGNTLVDASGNWTFVCSCLSSTDKVTATATDLLGNTSEFYYDPSLITDASILSILDSSKLVIYPNPVKEILYVLGLTPNFSGEVTVYTMIGQKVISEKQEGSQLAIDTKELSKGIYLLQLKSKNGESELRKFNKE